MGKGASKFECHLSGPGLTRAPGHPTPSSWTGFNLLVLYSFRDEIKMYCTLNNNYARLKNGKI